MSCEGFIMSCAGFMMSCEGFVMSCEGLVRKPLCAGAGPENDYSVLRRSCNCLCHFEAPFFG